MKKLDENTVNEAMNPVPDAGYSAEVCDESAEIQAAEARFKAGIGIKESSKDYHKSAERRARPSSMDQGRQILGAQKKG